MERLYKVSEATKLLSVSRKKIYNMIKDGKLKTVKIDGMIRIPESSLKEIQKQ